MKAGFSIPGGKMAHTTIDHDVRKRHGLTLNEYAICDSIYHLSRGGYCIASKEYLGEFIGITRRGTQKILVSLKNKGLIEAMGNKTKTTNKWDYEILNLHTTANKVRANCEQSSTTANKVRANCEQSSHNINNIKTYNDIINKDSDIINSVTCNNSVTPVKQIDNGELEIYKELDVRLQTHYLYSCIQAKSNPPTWANKPPNTDQWQDDIEKLHRIDGIDFEKIHRVIEWATSDPFWSGNILSGSKLRKHFDRLYAGMTKPKPKGYNKGFDPKDPGQKAAYDKIMDGIDE